MFGRLNFIKVVTPGRNYLVVLFISITAWSQIGSLKGKVVDRETLQPLAAANVILENTHFGSVSDSKGEFILGNLPVGNYTISASRVGYLPQKLHVVIQIESTEVIQFLLDPYILPGEEIVITGTRATKDMPVTFSNISKQTLDERYVVQDVPELLSQLPSTTFYSENGNGIGYNYVNIRGFDQRRIAVMINGVPQNDPEDHNVYWLDFPDLMSSTQDIQVQRGAGSAFYGPPAIGGSINIITDQFSDARKIIFQTAMGSYQTRKYSVSYQSGILDNKYSIHGRISKVVSNGYRDHSWVDFNSYYLNISKFDKDLTTQLNFYGGPITDGLAYYGIPKQDLQDRTRRRLNPIQRPQEIENFSQPHYEILNVWRLNDHLTLSNTLFYVTGEGFFDYDGSWVNDYGSNYVDQYFRFTQNGYDTTNAIPTNTLIRAWVENKQAGWLPRLDWKHLKGELSAGAEFRIHRSLHWGKLQWAENLPAYMDPDYHYYDYRGSKDILSIYLHEVYRSTPNLTLLGDLQYVYNQYRIYDEQYAANRSFSIPYHFLNPRLGANYRVTEHFSLFGNLAYTSREPRLKNLYDAAESSGGAEPQFEIKPSGGYDFTKPLVKPERLVNYELGTNWTRGNLTLTGNLFWMDFQDEIIKSGQVDRFGQPITGNAKKTSHKGMELTGSYRIHPSLELNGNATVSSNRLEDYSVFNKIDDTTTVVKKLDGNPVAGFPDQMFNAWVSYKNNSGFSATVFWKFVGSYYTDNFKNSQNRVENYSVINFQLAYRIEKIFSLNVIEVKFQINNLLNTFYAASGEGDQFFPAAERNFLASVKFEL